MVFIGGAVLADIMKVRRCLCLSTAFADKGSAFPCDGAASMAGILKVERKRCPRTRME